MMNPSEMTNEQLRRAWVHLDSLLWSHGRMSAHEEDMWEVESMFEAVDKELHGRNEGGTK